jgi:Domain of unknown function (DUF5615)
MDEDAMECGLLAALRARRVDVIAASECVMIDKSDAEHLLYATAHGRVLYSFNIADYNLLHSQWVASGRVHGGVIVAPQQQYSVGVQLRRLLHLVTAKSAEDMQSRLEYLSNWSADF